jgi:alpha-ribazole phosphatase
MNACGRRQAEALAERLSSIHFDIVFTSDLSRASQTADIIGAGQAREVPITAMTELRELDYGLWEGLTRQEASVKFADAWSAWNKGGRVGRPTGGEDSLSLLGRAGWAFDRAMQEGKEGKTVLISTHRVTLRTILCYALGLDLTLRSRFAVRNCALSALECHPGYRPRIVLLNDACHLDHQGL